MRDPRSIAITVAPLNVDDAEELLRFELDNRAFFARSIPDRGDDYYSLGNVASTIERALEEQRQGTSYMHLIRDGSGQVVGRINLFDVQRGPVQKAEIGYRIAERHSGKGYATKAVSLVAADGFDRYGLHRIEAATSPQNVGSQIVLLKNGFQFWGRARSSFHVGGAWRDSVLLERIAGEEPA